MLTFRRTMLTSVTGVLFLPSTLTIAVGLGVSFGDLFNKPEFAALFTAVVLVLAGNFNASGATKPVVAK